ncbi:unnamed protein product [Adineta steineri]|uniref:Uncharacterized protein n=1 Tax=Adineta steineri TaxID=433720 RepID=A0A815RHP9_9BILA|nr:unnamed protein product [Adineta steineri]
MVAQPMYRSAEYRFTLTNILEEDINDATLALLQQNDLIQIFSRVKDRVKFVDQRIKLILHHNDQQANRDAATLDVFDSALSLVQVYDGLENNDMLNSVDANENIEINNRASATDPGSSSSLSLNDDADVHTKPMLPDDYEGPNSNSRMEEYIEQENISKFNPHKNKKSPSNVSNEVAHVSPEQSDPDRYTSSQLNITTSRNIDDENISEVDEDAFNQPSATVEDRFYQSSSTTRRLSVFLTISSIMIQNKSAEVSHVQISFSNLNLKELHHIHTSQILSLTQQCENESNRTVNSDESSSTVTDKRDLYTSSLETKK